MAALAADSTAVEFMGPPGAHDFIELPAGAADTFYKNAVVVYSGSADGVICVPASGLEFAGFVMEQKVAAAGDLIKVRFAGLARITGLAVALASIQAGQGQLGYVDISLGSDNPKDLIFAGTAAGDVGFGTIIRAISTTQIIVDISRRAAAASV